MACACHINFPLTGDVEKAVIHGDDNPWNSFQEQCVHAGRPWLALRFLHQAKPTMNNKHDKILFWGCFIALITTSYAFISRMILSGGQFATDFGLDKVTVGELQ